MAAPVVWLNKYLGNTWNILARLRQERRPGEFVLLHSHPNANNVGRDHADSFEDEPAGLSDAEYVEFCLDFARRHRVALFWPGWKRSAMAAARKRFEALGTRLLVAGDAATLATVGDKGRLYRTLAGEDFRLPEYAIVNDLAGFDAAWKDMRPRHRRLCYKPAVSVFGIGFHVVVDRPVPQRLFIPMPARISLDDARRQLAAKGRFGDLMLMQYMPGPERSVDCLALDGQLVTCVVRRKQKRRQIIEDLPALVDVVARLIRRLRLNGIVNVQFREVAGEPHLLEINPRMSGGLVIACAAGVNLPLWAIRLALGTAKPDDVPEPATGLIVPQPKRMSSV